MNPKVVLAKMTREEKVSLVQGASFFGTQEIKRLQIPAIRFLDGGTGINFEQLFGDFCALPELQVIRADLKESMALANVAEHFYEKDYAFTEEELQIKEAIEKLLFERTKAEYAPACFPTGMLLGATFDPALVYETGIALGEEARFFGIDVLLGTPNINIHRDPLNGRLFESFSEDPCVIKTLAPMMVKGVQKKGVLANVKHFAANNQETNRLGINEIISERALEEIYLPGFQACVKEGNVKTLMSAYNAINGVACTENKELLIDKLRDEWGFEGCVISDWGAVYHPVRALQGGTNLAMPGPMDATPIHNALQTGELKEDELDRNVLAILGMVKEVLEGRKESATDAESLYKLTERCAYETALGGCVLLKNKDFPLTKENTSKLYLTGSASEKLLDCGRGSAGITTSRTTSLKETLHVNIPGLLTETISSVSKEFVPEDNSHIIVVAAVNGMEGNDRKNLYLGETDRELLEWLVAYKKEISFSLTLVLNVCGPVDLRAYEKAIDNLWLCFLPGMQGARALGDLMCAKANPSGKLPVTFPRKYTDTPTCISFPGDGTEICYGEGIFVGYRYYEKKEIEPAYPFGFGLSYTTFAMSFVKTDEEKNAAYVPYNYGKISVRIQNTGSYAGAEVVQLYISDPFATLTKPVKELKKFKKVYLEPGEEQIIDFIFSEEDFASYDPNLHAFTVEEGLYDLILAQSSRDVADSLRIYLDCRSPYSYGANSSVKEFYENPELKELLLDFLSEHAVDRQLTDGCYQYTSQKKLKEVLTSDVIPTRETEMFYKRIDEVIKKW
ncbi:MAG: hypothetical protein E7288_04005 [Lachnospiraceae bacterium]|nr:hypothetical protein [Lachnospiraceae bacterium]